jgi:multiple sugar transport system ATP-binding protein
MDEPLANLDAKLRTEMRTEVVSIQQDLGVTMIHVTHNQEEAMTMGDRVVVMDGGEVQQIAPPKETYQKPANRFVAEFIGSPSMNIVEVEVVERDGAYTAVHPTFEITLPAKPSLAEAAGGTANLGVRPQDLHLVETPTEFSFEVEVAVTETLGDQLLIFGHVGDNDVRVLSEDPRQQLRPEEVLHVECDPDRLHLFDVRTGGKLYDSTPEQEVTTQV